VRLRPFLIPMVFALAMGVAGGPACAQRWTPLTGMLAPESDGGAETGALADPVKPKDDQPPAQSAPAPSGVATSKLSLRATLESTTTDGQPHGSLAVRTMGIDADLSDALGLPAGQGAIVTEASSATAKSAGILPGDVIQKFEGRDVASADALGEDLRKLNPGQQVTLDVWRAGQGSSDLKRLLVERADAGNVGASASLGRLLSLGLVFGDKNFSEAATYYLKAADAGHLASMTRYALFAKDGIGIAKDEALAAKWFLKAAERGQDAAMTNLGSLYETGRGVKQDYAEAARWYRQAVDKGHVFAMHKLALLYEAGRGVAKDDQEAVRLLQAASDKGLSEATSWLADKYEQGRGIPKNDSEAYKLSARAAEQVRRAADLGNAVATFNLGILYRIGKGVKRSDTEASYWVVRSLKLGDKYLIAELMRNPNVLSVDDRKWLQEVLRDEGAYKGPINGSFTPDVRTAMEDIAKRA